MGKGKGVDVPILLAKLKDYEVRVKNLQGKLRMLMNKKLNEMVTRRTGTSSSKDEAQKEPTDSISKASSDSFSAEKSDDGEEGTVASIASDDVLDDHFNDRQS